MTTAGQETTTPIHRQLLDLLVRWTRSWWFVCVLVVIYTLVGLHALSDDRYLNDEGILTYIYSEFLRRDFVPSFFWLKSHPALALLNLPGAALGLGGFFVLHVFIGAAGIIFIAVAARRAGIREVGVAPLVLATSPIYAQGGASGIANVDGAAIASGALALYLAQAPGFIAGMVAGTLPFVRFELGLFSLMLAVMATTRGQRRFLCGLACVPLTYLGAGAVYHGTLMWFVAFPPAWGHWDPSTLTVAAESVSLLTMGDLIRSLGLTLPALPLLLLRRQDVVPEQPFDRAFKAFLTTFIAVITLFPFAHVAFPFDGRYFLTGLPVVALLAARAVDSIGVRRGSEWALRALIAAACAIAASWYGAWGLAATAATATVVLAAGGRLSPVEAVVAVSLVLPVTFGFTLPSGNRWRDELQMVTAWLRTHRAEFGSVPIYTNLKLLSAFAARSGNAPGLDIVGLIQPDMRLELLGWTNPANGQRERIWQLAHEVSYGRGAEPAEIIEGRAPAGSLLVLIVDDIRTNEMFPPSFLTNHTRTLAASPGVFIAVLLPRDATDR